MKDMGEIIKHASELQSRMKKVQSELDRQIVAGVAGGGLVRVEMNGRHDVSKVVIDECLMADRDVLQDLIAGAINDAVQKIDDVSQEKLVSLTQGLNVNMPFNWPS